LVTAEKVYLISGSFAFNLFAKNQYFLVIRNASYFRFK